MKLRKIDWFMLSLPVIFFLVLCYQMADTKEEIHVKTVTSVSEYELNMYDHQYLFYQKDSGKDLYIYVEEDGILYLSYSEGLQMENEDEVKEKNRIDAYHYVVEKGDVLKLVLPEINKEISNVDVQVALEITAYNMFYAN